MIKISDGVLKIEGTRIELVSEFMCIMNSMLEKGIISEEKLISLIILACIPKDELKSMIINEIDQMDDIGKALRLLNRLGD